MKKVTVSAPGKIYLSGEHAVVYGKPALLATIEKRLYVTVEKIEGKKSREKEIWSDKTEKNTLIKEAVREFKNAYRVGKLPSFKISISSDIPVGCGLGSSAALSSALIGALSKFVKNIWNPKTINELSYKVEKIAHSNPSGADNTVVVFGGIVWFRKEFEFLKSIWSLPTEKYKIPRFLIINTGRPKESTKEMINKVAGMCKRDCKGLAEILNNQEIQTKCMLMALYHNDKKLLISSIKNSQRNLEKMGAAGTKTRKLIRKIEKLGGAAKITGAGGAAQGSGMLLCYGGNLQIIEKTVKKYGLDCFEEILGGEGARIEK